MSSTNSPTKYTFVLDDFRGNETTRRAEPFCLSNNSEIKFELCVRSNLHPAEYDGASTTIYIHLVSSNKEPVNVEYRLSIVNHGEKVKTQEGQETFSIAKRMRYGASFRIERDFLLDLNNGLIARSGKDPQGKWIKELTVCCEIKEIKITEIANDNSNSSSQENDFYANMQTLLDSGKYSDAILFVGGKELRVHKNILSARSKVFGAMFEHDCEEKRQNRVEITDIQLDVCKELLRYLYTAKVESVNKLAVELLVASDLYEMEDLKEGCEKYLMENLSIETVSDILLVADLHQAKQLKAKCIDFISENDKEVQGSSGWEALTTKADLIAEIILKVEKHKECSNPSPKEETLKEKVQDLNFDYLLLSEWQLRTDLGTLINNGKFSDAVLLVNGEELRVHKNILTAHSKVFADIFEFQQDRLELTDMSVEVYKQLLRYIYSAAYYPWNPNFVDELSIEGKYASELLVLSEKYQLSGLKFECEWQLSQSLTIESVSSTLLLADKDSTLSYLKEKCIEYITANCRQITKTEGWKILVKTKPELVVQLYENIADKQWY